MSKIFGIDLGTTYSCIAYVDEYGKPMTVPNLDNSPVTPSVVFFESPESFSVGEVAKQMLNSDPDRVCSTVKRQMGSDLAPTVVNSGSLASGPQRSAPPPFMACSMLTSLLGC